MKKKKIISILLTASAIVMITSCGKNDNPVSRDMSSKTSVQNILEQGAAEPDNAIITSGKTTGEQANMSSGSSDGQPDAEDKNVDGQADTDDEIAKEQTDSDGVDVDLTVLSSTMVYSEVYDMMYYPENYIGKSVKMKGMYAGYHDESTDKYYHACIIQDATACCAQGIEFEPTDDYIFPDDYPAEGHEVCVTGVFDTYEEGENKYCTLRDARLN